MELFSGSGLAAVQFYAALLLIAFLAVRLVSFLWTSLSQKFRESAIVVNLHCNGVHAPCSYWTEKGGRPYQEDRFCMRGDTTRVKCSIYAVFDGHGGSMASQYCKENVMARIMNQPLLDENPVKAMETAILEVDREFSDKARKQNLTDGSTVLVALIHNAKIYVANVGDSRCILVQTGGRVRHLSVDHKPSREDEVARIRDLGGKVIFWGRWRVQGVLAVSRAIGDVGLKPYVTAEPEIIEKDLSSEDSFLVLASDGLWDVMSNEDCANFVYRNRDFKDLGRALCYEAMLLGSNDNVTVLVVDLKRQTVSSGSSGRKID